jgi:4-azaleucine resistance transporter AzlC
MSGTGTFLLGVRAALPIVVGYVPIAISFGIVARDGGLPLWLAGLMSAIVYAGASQFAAVAMLRLGAPVPEIVLATFFLNLRHLVMGLALIPKLPPGPARTGVAAALTDETFAVASFHPDARLRTVPAMAGLVLTAWAAWLGGTVLGGMVADALPRLLANAMGVALYGLFIGLLVPAVRVVPKGLVAAVAAMAANWAALQVLPPGWAIIAAILAGASVGAVAAK